MFYNKLNYCFWIILMISIFNVLVINSRGKFVPLEEQLLKKGNCKDAVLGDLVFQDHIYKPAIPLIIRNATATWHGDHKIYCVMVLPQKEQATVAEILIKEGGVDHSFVTVEIHSKRSEGLDYIVQVFGKKL